MPIPANMPKYKCHKTLRALKIKEIVLVDKQVDGLVAAVIIPVEWDWASITVTQDYMDKHKPEVGGYYIVYEDGYKSFLPAKAFEDGYTLVTKEYFAGFKALRDYSTQLNIPAIAFSVGEPGCVNLSISEKDECVYISASNTSGNGNNPGVPAIKTIEAIKQLYRENLGIIEFTEERDANYARLMISANKFRNPDNVSLDKDIVEPQRKIAIEFLTAYFKMSPRDLCTVHPPAGSGAGIGIYNRSIEDIFNQWFKNRIKPV